MKKVIIASMLLLVACKKDKITKTMPLVIPPTTLCDTIGIEGVYYRVGWEVYNYKFMDSAYFTKGVDSFDLEFPLQTSVNKLKHKWRSAAMPCGKMQYRNADFIFEFVHHIDYRGDTLVDSMIDKGLWIGNNLFTKKR